MSGSSRSGTNPILRIWSTWQYIPILVVGLLQTTYLAQAEEIYYYHNDHLGKPEFITDANQKMVWKASRNPFGGEETALNIVKSSLRFPGQYYDNETGFHYNWNRYYSPETGRYVSSDPIGLDGGLNTYLYVYSNPLRFVDPEGLESPIGNWPPNGVPSQPLPGYNYCGPRSRARLPTNSLDAACRAHDECYMKCGITASAVSIIDPGQCDDNRCQDRCDDRLCEAAGVTRGWILVGVKYLFCD